MIKHDHTHLTSSAPEKVVEFYERTLGAKITRELTLSGGKGWDLDMGGVNVRVSGSTAADEAQKDKGPIWGLHHIGLEVSDLDELAAKLKANNVEFVVEPRQTRPGSKVAFIKGPDDALFELIERK